MQKQNQKIFSILVLTIIALGCSAPLNAMFRTSVKFASICAAPGLAYIALTRKKKESSSNYANNTKNSDFSSSLTSETLPTNKKIGLSTLGAAACAFQLPLVPMFGFGLLMGAAQASKKDLMVVLPIYFAWATAAASGTGYFGYKTTSALLEKYKFEKEQERLKGEAQLQMIKILTNDSTPIEANKEKLQQLAQRLKLHRDR